jgi:HAD superfamily hydrolase (TIGR01509 family)
MMIKALAFDFDGLILDTEGPVYQSWQELFQSFGYQLTLEEWQICLGSAEGTSMFFDNLEEKLGGSVDLEEIAPKRLERELQLIAKQPIRPGVSEYISEAHKMGLKLGVASSSNCAWVTGHLEQRGLKKYFTCILGADDVELTKPDPALYLAILDSMGVRAHEAIAFEDSPNGILAAKRAGMYCVAVPNPLTKQLLLDGSDLVLDSLANLPLQELIERVEGGR